MRFLSVRLTLIVICSGSPREKYNCEELIFQSYLFMLELSTVSMVFD